MKRRDFIKTTGALSGGLLFGKSPAGKTPFSEIARHAGKDPEDASFWEFVRLQFLLPEDYAYLNTAGLGAIPAAVHEKVAASIHRMGIEPRPGHDIEDWWDIKNKCAGLFGSGCTKEEIALTNTATEGINIILNGLPLKEGDEVITSTHEHPALNIALLNLAHRTGIRIRTFEPDFQDGLGNARRIEDLINRRTRLIFISHVSCTTGQRFPSREIGSLARARGIWLALDGAQAVGSLPVDMKREGIDFYAISGHKWILGPKRTGVLFVDEKHLETLRPVTAGAYTDHHHDLLKRELTLQASAQRYEYGTQNEALFEGMGVGIDFIDAIGIQAVWRRNRALGEMFYEGLESIGGIEILSPVQAEYRTSMISFRIKQKNYREIASHLSKNRIRVRVVPEAGLEAIRVSFHIYNNEDEVEKALHEIRAVAV